MTKWTIAPLLGLGPLRLGMSNADVATLLDPLHTIVSSRVQFDGSVREARGLALPFCTFISGKLQSIEINRRVEDVLFEGQDVFKSRSRDIIGSLAKANGKAVYAFGTLLFYDLSISTGGFYEPKRGYYGETSDNWQDERTLTVSVEHAFQALLPQFKKVKLTTIQK